MAVDPNEQTEQRRYWEQFDDVQNADLTNMFHEFRYKGGQEWFEAKRNPGTSNQ